MRKSGRARKTLARTPTQARGAASVMAILMLPVLLAALSSLVGLGDALLLRHRVSQAADLGALAAVQCLDLAKLAEGSIVLLPGQAKSVARKYVLANLRAEDAHPGDVSVEVDIHNPGDRQSRDRVTGKAHEHPTVCVQVTCSHHFRMGPLRLVYEVFGHADASAVPR